MIVTIHTQGFKPCMWDEERGPLTRAIDGLACEVTLLRIKPRI